MTQTGYGQTFARRAAAYERAMARHPEVRRREFQVLVQSLKLRGSETLLDVPSGGAYLRRYLPGSLTYWAADESVDFHAACPGRLRAGDLAVVAPCHQLPFPASKVDVVCSVAGLHHLPDRAAAYAEWQRMLAPGGRLVIADVATGTHVADFLNGFVDRYCSQGHQGVFLDAGDERLLAETRFESVAAHDAAYSWRFTSLEQAVDFCLDLFGLDLPGAREALPAELARLGLHQTASAWRLPWTLRYLTAVRPAVLSAVSAVRAG